MVQELEKGGGNAADAAGVKDRLAKLEEELRELRGENDFLNGEVARATQKNKELQKQLASLRES
jgi:chromosome segregation ATPase